LGIGDWSWGLASVAGYLVSENGPQDQGQFPVAREAIRRHRDIRHFPLFRFSSPALHPQHLGRFVHTVA